MTTSTSSSGKDKSRKSKSTVIEPTLITRENQHIIQYSVHTCPVLLRDDLSKVFPSIPNAKQAFILPIMQPTNASMTEFTQESEQDKNSLLEMFLNFAKQFVSRVKQEGDYWVDYTDPVTGYPVLTQAGGMLYSDVDACEILLRYRVDTVGGTCRILSHPNWGTSVYPATIVTMAPLDVITKVLADM